MQQGVDIRVWLLGPLLLLIPLIAIVLFMLHPISRQVVITIFWRVLGWVPGVGFTALLAGAMAGNLGWYHDPSSATPDSGIDWSHYHSLEDDSEDPSRPDWTKQSEPRSDGNQTIFVIATEAQPTLEDAEKDLSEKLNGIAKQYANLFVVPSEGSLFQSTPNFPFTLKEFEERHQQQRYVSEVVHNADFEPFTMYRIYSEVVLDAELRRLVENVRMSTISQFRVHNLWILMGFSSICLFLADLYYRVDDLQQGRFRRGWQTILFVTQTALGVFALTWVRQMLSS